MAFRKTGHVTKVVLALCLALPGAGCVGEPVDPDADKAEVVEPIYLDLDTPGVVLNEAQFRSWASQVRDDSHYIIRWGWDRTRPQWVIYRDIHMDEPTRLRVVAVMRCEPEPAHRHNLFLRRLTLQDLRVQVNPDLDGLPQSVPEPTSVTVSRHFYPYDLGTIDVPAGRSRVVLTVGGTAERRLYFSVDGVVLIPEGADFGVDDYLRQRDWK